MLEFTRRKIDSTNMATFQIYGDGSPIFNIQEWMLQCCGVAGIYNVNRYHPIWSDEAEITALFEWLDTVRPLENHWACKEWLFALSTDQTQEMVVFMKHPNVRQVDVFKNKAHGPNKIHLVRYSLNKDFKSV